MACDNKVNHKQYFEKSPEVVGVNVETVTVDEPVVEPVFDASDVSEDIVETINEPLYTKDELFGLIKSEQIDILEQLKVSNTEIKKLKLEKQRVEKILELT